MQVESQLMILHAMRLLLVKGQWGFQLQCQ
jgi:hypothetical protein